MSALVHAEVDGERLTRDEIAAFFVLLSVAGNDTTRHTTSHAMRALTAQPRPGGVAARGPRRADAGRGRGVHPLGDAGDDVPPHHDPRGRAPRPDDPGRREGDPVLPVGQPRRGGVRRTPGSSTSRATPTTTSGSAAAGRTSASARRWRARSCGRSSPRCYTQIPDIEVGELVRFDSGGFVDAVKRLDCTFTAAPDVGCGA